MSGEIYASIIQGEAGVLGPVGMYAVATVISSQISANWYIHDIESCWYGRAEPSGYACLLGELLTSGTIPASGYLYCMSRQDVNENKWHRGDLVISARGTNYELHLYKEYPGNNIFYEVEKAAVKMIGDKINGSSQENDNAG